LEQGRSTAVFTGSTRSIVGATKVHTNNDMGNNLIWAIFSYLLFRICSPI